MIAYILFFLSFLFFFVASSATAYVYGLKAARLSGCKPPAHVIDAKDSLNTEAPASPLKRVSASCNLVALRQESEHRVITWEENKSVATDDLDSHSDTPWMFGALPVAPPPSLAGSASGSDVTSYSPDLEDFDTFRRAVLKSRRRREPMFYF